MTEFNIITATTAKLVSVLAHNTLLEYGNSKEDKASGEWVEQFRRKIAIELLAREGVFPKWPHQD